MNIQELTGSPDYELVAVVKHDEVKPFVKREMERNEGWARVANMYQLAGWLVIMLGLFKAFMPFYTKREYLYLLYLLGGAVALFTVGIVLHEAIHALAYRYVGARHVSWGANPRKFQFYVLADGEVLDYRRFRIVALAPAVAITVLALAGMAVCYNQPLFYSFLAVLGLHGLCCAGDFGLLCVFQNYGEQSVLTFDDRVRGLTCFYRRRAVPDEAEWEVEGDGPCKKML